MRYRYVAPNLSLLERLYLDQFWTAVATHAYPPWLAPNVITLSGGVCIVLAAALSAWYSPQLLGASPPWMYALNAVLLSNRCSPRKLQRADPRRLLRTGDLPPRRRNMPNSWRPWGETGRRSASSAALS